MPRRPLVARLVACGLVAVGLTVVTAVVIVRRVVLRADTYTSALVEADAYERIYTDVLADPELAELKEQLLGDIGVPAELAVQGRALTTNVLRWVAPPSTLQAIAESVVRGGLAYVRGDEPRLTATVVIDDVAARIPDTTVRQARTLLASAADHTVATLPAFRTALAELADHLAAGIVPAEIPVVGGTTFEPDVIVDAILEALGEEHDEAIRELVTGAVLAGDQRGAVIDAAALAVADRAAAAADQLRAEPQLDVVALAAERAGRPVSAIVERFDAVRDIARWFGVPLALVGALVAAAGAWCLLRLTTSATGRAAMWLGGAVAAAGVVLGAGYVVLIQSLASPLAPATSTGGSSWRFPPVLAELVGDVAAGVQGRLSAVVWRSALTLLGAGLLIAGGTAALRWIRRPAVRTIVAVGIVTAVLVAFAGMMATRPRHARACNGHVELCDRPYDEVAYAATHNSMSSPDVVPVWPEHDGGLTAQLDAGVRALLIDTHHWEPLNSVGRLADLVQPGEPRLPPSLAAVLYGTIAGLRDGRPGTFLCHIHCGFGAQPLVEGLGEVRRFLVANPEDVVTLIIQDAITPAETVAAFDAAGLTGFVHPQRADRPWPTLDELIDRGDRLVVFAENEGPPPDWYASAFEAMQETPFLFLSPEDFSCDENRGPSDASLFQLNHWVQRIAPDRADSARVNQLDVLVERARECQRLRGRMPNFLAVNFYNIGDVVAAADVLNGVSSSRDR